MSLANFQGLAPDIRDKLRFLAESQSMAGRVYLLNGAQAARQDKVMQTLQTFAASPEGKLYFDTWKLGGYRQIKPGELEPMERYADEVRQVLKQSAQ